MGRHEHFQNFFFGRGGGNAKRLKKLRGIRFSSNFSNFTNSVFCIIPDKVSPQKQLRGGLTFIDEVPKSQSGKVLRRLLKQNISLYEIPIPVTLRSISKNLK